MASIYKRKGRGPYVISYFDHTGRRRNKSSRTTDKRTAKRIADKLEANAALRREGVVDARQDRIAVHGRKPLADHILDYLEHCRQAGMAAKTLHMKRAHLQDLIDSTGATRLTDLQPEVVGRYLAGMKGNGKSARTVNQNRADAVALVNWCLKTGRIESNPICVVPKLDEQRDRRRVRRPLTDEELARLFDAAGRRGRKAWYMAAVLAGLRKGDLQRLRWCDIDFERGTIVVCQGKAKRQDLIPMHPQLAEELRRRRGDAMATPQTRVFPQSVTDATRLRDFLRAGIAREIVVTDNRGDPVMMGKGRRRRPKTRITTENARDR